MNNPSETIVGLLFQLLDNQISDDEFAVLEEWLRTEPGAVEYYHKFMMDYSCLVKGSMLETVESSSEEFQKQMVREFFEEILNRRIITELSETKAPVQTDMQPAKSVKRKKYTREQLLGKFYRIAAVFIFAFMIIAADQYLMKHRQIARQSVGRMIASYQASWDRDYCAPEAGDILYQDTLVLKEGLAEFVMEDGSKVLLEAPAEVRLESDSRVFLSQGKLTAKVPPEGVGFTVRTPSATVVDFGTEFGVLADQYGETEAHVIKGEVELRLGSNVKTHDQSMRLTKNQAGRVAGRSLNEIPAKVNAFAYNLPSRYEAYIKETLHPNLYLRLTREDPDSFQDMIQKAPLTFGLDDTVKVVQGPAIQGAETWAFKLNGMNAFWIDGVMNVPQVVTGDFTVSQWVYFDESQKEQQVSCHHVLGSGDYHRVLMMGELGKMNHIAFMKDNTRSRRVNANMVLNPKTWYLVTVSHERATGIKKIYINGQLISRNQAIQVNNLAHYDQLYYGYNNNGVNGLRGAVSEIMLFSRVLKDKEVQTLYGLSGL